MEADPSKTKVVYDCVRTPSKTKAGGPHAPKTHIEPVLKMAS